MALTVLTIGLERELFDRLKDQLEGQGASLRSAIGFDEGGRLLREQSIDVLLVDVDKVGLRAALAGLDETRVAHPEVGRMILIDEPTVDSLLKCINRAGVDHVFTGADGLEQIASTLRIDLGLDVELPIKPGDPIMVVEKDPALRKALRTVLSDWGFHVDDVPTGTEALKLMRTENYRAILANRNISYLMGWTLVEFIKRNVKYRHVPILMLTDQADAEAEADIKEKEVEGFVHLPLVEPMLRRKLAEVLKRK